MKKYSIGQKYTLPMQTYGQLSANEATYLATILNEIPTVSSICLLYLKASNLYSKEKQLEFDKTDPKVGIQISMMAISCPSFQDDYLGCAVKAVFCSNIVFNIISLCRTKLL